MGYAERVKFPATAENLTYYEYLKIKKLEAKSQANPHTRRADYQLDWFGCVLSDISDISPGYEPEEQPYIAYIANNA